LLQQPPLDDGVVLDDAVVDDGEAPTAGRVRVRVEVARRAVRGPARVPHPDRALDRPRGQQRGQFVHFALFLADRHAAVEDSDAGRIVPAVFKPFETSDEKLARVAGTDVSDDATHSAYKGSQRKATKLRTRLAVAMTPRVNLRLGLPFRPAASGRRLRRAAARPRSGLRPRPRGGPAP